ncbi:anti-sigma factor family protein [Streptomyces sp. NPDC048644]|uniref:anti-sigma factor family protein n=1 Tax=Streptomyces sp. NPDC048644 TaxID=3365582 RepID=UPI00371C38CD
MTSSTGTDEHPEVAEISDLTDGLLSPSRTVELREHLATCALCEDVHASLEEIRGLLGTLPGPVRMPADIAGRIDAALAAEALLDATSPVAEADVSRETADGSDAVSRETATEASPAGGSSRPAGHPRGSSGPGRRPGGRTPRARRWPRILLGTAAAAAVFSVGGLLVQNSTTTADHDGGQDRPTTATGGGNDGLTSATLGARVHELLASKGAQKSPEIGTRSEPETPMRGGADTVPSCVSRGIGRPETPIVSRQSRYEGKDAYLVVLPAPSDPKRVTAYVVDSSCVSATPPSPGKVLLTHSYPRD